MTQAPHSEVLAIKYAETVSPDREHFLMGHDPHDGPHPISYFLWLIRHENGLVLVDTGFGERAAAERGRTLLRDPLDALASLGVQAEDIETVVLTHMHYDHAGSVGRFPNATVIVQERELAYAAGPAMRHPACRKAFDVEDVTDVVRTLYDGRIYPVSGDRHLFPGISVHLVGGHSKGLQVVRVETDAGRLVIASDATHFYETAMEGDPFPVLCEMPAYLEGFDRLFELADDPNLVVPGHDERVLSLFPALPGDPNVLELHKGPLVPTPFAGRRMPVVREP
ncbi:N-acyl homoserine lactonase family protein [Kaustia mangrovi]|uniref:N-acyl homoserine lactonase family protein n=1 Tax=Kaustia mangrovi TaxID=2593653 RepID=A0A7S8HDK0_9HYPH|nr:N-acyl homoserine lactonase family protein [Kaustia mangrovi]QPC44549.1 N-acyl homoserine lactonase family protein [Kaustia mangrovi]